MDELLDAVPKKRIQYIPEFLYDIRKDWMSLGVMDKKMRLEAADGSIARLNYIAQRMKLTGKRVTSENSRFATYYQVKSVVARARAHGFVPVEPPKTIEEPPPKVAEETTIPTMGNKFYWERERQLLSLKKQVHALSEQVDSLNAIISEALLAEPITDAPGVYFLCNRGKVVYVGKSETSVTSRIQGRANLVEYARMIPCDNPKEIAEMEKRWVKRLLPPGNTHLK